MLKLFLKCMHYYAGCDTTGHLKKTRKSSGFCFFLLVAHPVLIDPTTLGWSRNEMGLKPVLSSVPPAPEAITHLILCNYSKSECGGRCKCRIFLLSCQCEADVDKCRNHTVHFLILKISDV